MGNMARQMSLFLIRHGETVDNIAQVWAGSRDSELTNHGYQQATRLGLHFKALGLSFTHLFSSNLQRAAKTAGLIREAQAAVDGRKDPLRTAPDIIQLEELMEQDFGFLEGKKWNEGLVDEWSTVESKDSMARRADTFLDEHLLPLLNEQTAFADHVVAVVSHGILLSTLWKRLLLRLPPRSIVLSPELLVNTQVSLEHLGGWSNTGYLELLMQKAATQESTPSKGEGIPLASEQPTTRVDISAVKAGVGQAEAPQAPASGTVIAEQIQAGTTIRPSVAPAQLSPTKIAHGWTTTIKTINGKDHLKNLKRTGGGVGSSRHDASQKNIDSFFKKRKVEGSE